MIGCKYLTSGSVKDNKECRELGRFSMGNSVARKVDRRLAVGEKGRSHSAGCGESHNREKLLALRSHILAASRSSFLRQLSQDRRPFLEEPSRSGGSKTFQETWGRSGVLEILSVQTLFTDNTSVVHLSSKSRTLEEIRRWNANAWHSHPLELNPWR